MVESSSAHQQQQDVPQLGDAGGEDRDEQSTRNKHAAANIINKLPAVRAPPPAGAQGEEDVDEVVTFAFTEPGPLGIQFDGDVHPFKITNLEEGQCKSRYASTFPCPALLVAINGKMLVEGSTWEDDLLPPMVERPVRISVKRLLEEESAASVMFSSLATGLTSGLNTAQQAAAGAASTASWSRVGLGAGLGGLSESLGGAAKLGTNMKTALNFWQAGEVEGSEQEEVQVPARAGGGSSTSKEDAAANATPGAAGRGALSSRSGSKNISSSDDVDVGSSGVSLVEEVASTRMNAGGTILRAESPAGQVPLPPPRTSTMHSTSPGLLSSPSALASPSKASTVSEDLSMNLQIGGATGSSSRAAQPQTHDDSSRSNSKKFVRFDPATRAHAGDSPEIPGSSTASSTTASSSAFPSASEAPPPTRTSGGAAASTSTTTPGTEDYKYSVMLLPTGPLGMELYMVKDNSMSPPMDETNDHRGLHRKPARFFVKSVSSDAGCASARTGIRPEDELIQIDEGPVNFDDLGNLTMALDNLRPVNCRFLRKVPLSDGAGGTSRSKDASASSVAGGLPGTSSSKERPPASNASPDSSSPQELHLHAVGAAGAAPAYNKSSERSLPMEPPTPAPPGARDRGDTSDSEQRYLMARQMADHWERECKQSHAHCVQLTTDFNQLIEEHETMEEAQGQFKARVMELEDMNIKWQARYEKQEKEVERLRKWVAEHGEDAQRLAEMEEGVTKLDELKSTVKKLTAENAETNEKLGGAEKALEDQKQVAAKLQETLDNLHTDHLGEIERLEASLGQANRAKRTLQSQIADLEETLRKRRESQNEDTHRSSVHKTRIEELESQSAAYQESCLTLRQERDHFSGLVDQCFEKMKRESQDRIYQVDRRVVCDSLTQFCKVDRVLVRSLMDNLYHVGGRNRPVLQSIDSEHHAQKLEILSRLADSLGFGPEEREQIGLNRSHLFHTLQNESNPVNLDADSPEDGPSQRGGASRSSQGIGTQFVEYLEKEVAEDPS